MLHILIISIFISALDRDERTHRKTVFEHDQKYCVRAHRKPRRIPHSGTATGTHRSFQILDLLGSSTVRWCHQRLDLGKVANVLIKKKFKGVMNRVLFRRYILWYFQKVKEKNEEFLLRTKYQMKYLNRKEKIFSINSVFKLTNIFVNNQVVFVRKIR